MESEKPRRGFVESIVYSALEPGVNSSLHVFVNVILVILVGLWIALLFIVGFSIHLIILAAITLGFLAVFNWVMTELRKNPQNGSSSSNTPQQEETDGSTHLKKQ
ncbi:hypothetical protein EMCRGX_G027799 [Ephydatia muelleri]